MTGQAWQVLLKKTLLERAPWISVWVERVQLPNGVVIDDYFRLELRSWVAVFAVTEDGRVPLVWQYRHGVGQYLLELPAGYLEDGEAAETCARRELREEVGCAAASFEPLGSFTMLPERSGMTMHVVLARGAQQVGGQQLEATEEITVRWLTLAELRQAWRDGRVSAASHATAIAHALDVLGAL